MILERYIIREVLAPQVAISTVLVIVFSGYSATRFLNDAVNGLLSGKTVAILVLLKVLIALEVLLPVTLYLAVIFALSRLYADNEIAAMEAGGISQWRIIKSVVLLAIPLAVLITGLSLYARPWAYEKIYSLEARAREEFDFAKVEAGRFYELGDDLVFFAEELDSQKKQARQVHIWKLNSGGREVTYAESAYQHSGSRQGKKALVFEKGNHYTLDLESDRDRVLAFQNNVLYLETDKAVPLEYRRKAASTAFLAGSEAPEDTAEFQWRISTGLSAVLMVLLAIPLSRVAPRHSKHGKTTAAIVLFFLYYNLSLIAKTWVEKQVLSPFPGIWWVNFLLGLLVLALVPSRKGAWLRSKFRKPS